MTDRVHLNEEGRTHLASATSKAMRKTVNEESLVRKDHLCQFYIKVCINSILFGPGWIK